MEEYNNQNKEEFDIMKFLFSLQGRIGKKEFLFYIAIEFLTVMVVGIIVAVMKMNKEEMEQFLGVVSLIFIYPNIAVSAKRAHDFNYSAWFAFVTLAPYIGFVLMIIMGFIEGNPEENKYGLPPKKKQ